MNGEEKFGRMGVRRAIMSGELSDFGALIVNVVAAHLAKENLPLAKEGLGFGAVGVVDDIVNEPHALPGARGYRNQNGRPNSPA